MGEPVQLEIYRTSIPMRSFEHAAAARDRAEAIVVRLECSDGSVGWGETLPRPYVTGETLESVVEDLRERLWPAFRAEGLEGIAAAAAGTGDGRCLNAAACALELAAIGAGLAGGNARVREALRAASGRSEPASRIEARVSGVLGSSQPQKTARALRLMRWAGLRDFKLKLGLGADVDAENLHVVLRGLGGRLRRGRCTLRVDVNGGWDAETVPERTAELAALGVWAVEQPVFCPAGGLANLARRCRLPLIADESLLTERDARALLAEPSRVGWNVRLSKNGGLLASIRLARLAAERGVLLTAGCMVGESAILSSAQRLLLQWGPQPRFVEGNYGRLLLRDDFVRRSPRFGYGGRLRTLPAGGFPPNVDARRLARHGRRVETLRA